MSYREQARTASGLNILAGIWLIISSYSLGMNNVVMSSNLFVVGIVVALIGLVRVSLPETTGGLSWLNFLMGIWVVISSFIMGGLTPLAFWSTLVTGLVIAGLAYWSTSSSRHLITH